MIKVQAKRQTTDWPFREGKPNGRERPKSTAHASASVVDGYQRGRLGR